MNVIAGIVIFIVVMVYVYMIFDGFLGEKIENSIEDIVHPMIND